MCPLALINKKLTVTMRMHNVHITKPATNDPDISGRRNCKPPGTRLKQHGGPHTNQLKIPAGYAKRLRIKGKPNLVANIDGMAWPESVT